MSLRSLQFKLLVLVALSLGLPLAVAMWSLGRLYAATEAHERVTHEDFLARETVLHATIRFEQQVREWKDVLLRGADPAALESHWAAFVAREADVKAVVREARAAIPYPDLRDELDAFLAAHAAAGERYRAGLQALRASRFDPRAGDDAVAGIDRQPTQLLLSSEKIGRERGTGALDAAVAAELEAYRVAMASIALVMVLALTALWFFIRRDVVRPVREAARFAERVAAGDLTGDVRARSRDEIGQLLAALAAMKASLTDIVRQMRTAAQAVATAAGDVSAGAAALSQQTEEQASSLEQTAASMEELATTVEQNAEHARRADAVAKEASRTAHAGAGEVRDVVTTMDGISAEARRIADIVAVIDTIAFQTNILALNAAVEAARAGEQGRGFAVVAAEVRTLAQRSAGAAKEIRDLIVGSSRKVDDGATLVEGAAATIDRLVHGVHDVSGLMTSIAEACAEQARSVQQVNRTITEMDKVVQHTAGSVHRSAASAEGMRLQAEQMVTAVNRFRLSEMASPSPRPAAALPEASGVIARIAARSQAGGSDIALAAASGDWKEF